MHSSVGVKDLDFTVERLNRFFTCRLPLFEHDLRKTCRETIMWWPNWIDKDGKFNMHHKQKEKHHKKY